MYLFDLETTGANDCITEIGLIRYESGIEVNHWSTRRIQKPLGVCRIGKSIRRQLSCPIRRQLTWPVE